MNEHVKGRDVIQIKKYPNRRYYDTTRSCHVTLHDVHDLILAGKDVCITDSRTGEDITNLVLTQILLEKEQPKLDIFPTAFFHMMIRSNRQMLRGYVDQFFAPMLRMIATSQKQFDEFLRTATGGAFMSPLDWANRMMEFFGQAAQARGPGSPTPIPDPEWDADAQEAERERPESPPSTVRNAGASSKADSIEELRAQAAELIRRIDQLSPTPNDEQA